MGFGQSQADFKKTLPLKGGFFYICRVRIIWPFILYRMA